MASEHGEELGSIDRRRVEGRGSNVEGFLAGLSAGLLVLASVIVLAGGVAVFAAFGGGGLGGQGPYNYGSVHRHGTINVTIDGKTLDFSQQK